MKTGIEGAHTHLNASDPASGEAMPGITGAMTHATGAHMDVELLEPALISSAESLKVHCYVDVAAFVHVPGFCIKFDEDSMLLDYRNNPCPAVILSHEGGPGTSVFAPATVIPEALQDSFSNYPNPFSAGREVTTFTFYLHRQAEARLRLFTGLGRLIRTLDPGTLRPGGLVHEDIQWDGRDDRGALVQNGAYFAVLDVRYTGGGAEEVVRKVAVLR
jgi:hypothetical protein